MSLRIGRAWTFTLIVAQLTLSACGGLGGPAPVHPSEGGPSLARINSVTFPAGAYNLVAVDQPAAQGALQNPYIAGMALRASWTNLEPSDGVYDWTYLDGQIRAAKANGKAASIYIAVSVPWNVPDWVYAAGAKSVKTSVGKLPVPWDAIFLKKWTAFVKALGSHYTNETAITYVRGSTEALTNGWRLPAQDSSVWRNAGYTDLRMQDALQTSIDAFVSAFPTTPNWAEVGNLDIEPAITGNAPDYMGYQVGTYGFGAHPNTFGVWQEALDECIPNPPTSGLWVTLWNHKGRDGAQMIWNVQDGPNFKMNPCGNSPNKKAPVLKAAVNMGITYGMPYEEIYEVDVLDPALQSVLAYAASNLGH